MAKLYRALAAFSCVANPESLKKRKSLLKMEDGEQKEALRSQIKWMDVEKGDKVVAFNDDIAKSWLDSGLVEEVKS